MDFEPDAQQQAIAEAVEALLARHAGPARALALQRTGAADDALDAVLADAGFLDVALAEGGGPLEAALVVEAVARAAGVVAVGAQALVAPGVLGRALAGPVALVDAAVPGAPVRFAAQARHALVLEGAPPHALHGGDATAPERARARLVSLGRGAAEPVASPWGYPVGRFAAGALAGGEPLGEETGERLVAWWRVALAVEAVGAIEGALAATVAYVARRRQFGRAIGSFQAVQHRLAAAKVELEGARWLAREAAWRGAPAEAAAVAAAFALDAAGRVFADTHQLSGAMGFTDAQPLRVWTTRLPPLRLELGGLAGHRAAVSCARPAVAP